MIWLLAVVGSLLLALFAYLFLSYVHRHSQHHPRRRKIKVMSVLGSGGHTTEMIELMRHFDRDVYHPRVYVIGDTDKLSESKVADFEKNNEIVVEKVARSREVGQSYISSVFTTLYASFYSFCIVWRHRPQLLLLNGPGTCIPIAFSAALLDFLRISDVFIVYEESICRVQRLSLSGLILYHSRIADEFIVQWKELVDKYPRTRLVANL